MAFQMLLRKVIYYGAETYKEFVFPSNNLEISAITVAIYPKVGIMMIYDIA